MSFDWLADEDSRTLVKNTSRSETIKLIALNTNTEKETRNKTLGVFLANKTEYSLGWRNAKDFLLDNYPFAGMPPCSARLKLEFELLSPLLTKDDIPYYLFDNPVRRDHVFHKPYLSAASLLGLSMDAFRRAYPKEIDSNNDYKQQTEQAERLFGNAPDGSSSKIEASQGRLRLSPAWFDRVAVLTMNKRKSENGTGSNPVQFEAIAKGQTSHFIADYFDPDNNLQQTMEDLGLWLQAITEYWPILGLGAKRHAGYGRIKPRSASLEGISWPVFSKAQNLSDNTINSRQQFCKPDFYEDYLADSGQVIKRGELNQRIEKLKNSQGNKQQVAELKQKMAAVKQDKAIPPQEKKQQITEIKKQIQQVKKGKGNDTEINEKIKKIEQEWQACQSYYKQATNAKKSVDSQMTQSSYNAEFKGENAWQKMAQWILEGAKND